MYNEKLLNKWNMTEEDCEKAINKIRIKGFRLTHEEKDLIFFCIMEGIIAEDDIESQIEMVEFERKNNEELKENQRKVREFVKEWRRIQRKYGYFGHEDKSLDELTDMWMTNYFELYFMGDHFDAIEDIGGKAYAQYYCYNVGICPESEVEMWK